MRKSRFVSMLVVGGMLAGGPVACEKEGPAERTGKQIDEAASEIKKDARRAADDVKEAAGDLQDKLED